MTTAARAAATSPFRLITLSSSCVWLPAQGLEALLRHVGATVAVFRKDATTRALPGEGRRGPGLFSGPNSYAPLSGAGARFRTTQPSARPTGRLRHRARSSRSRTTDCDPLQRLCTNYEN